jgi:hypothetical protein
MVYLGELEGMLKEAGGCELLQHLNDGECREKRLLREPVSGPSASKCKLEHPNLVQAMAPPGGQSGGRQTGYAPDLKTFWNSAHTESKCAVCNCPNTQLSYLKINKNETT